MTKWKVRLSDLVFWNGKPFHSEPNQTSIFSSPTNEHTKLQVLLWSETHQHQLPWYLAVHKYGWQNVTIIVFDPVCTAGRNTSSPNPYSTYVLSCWTRGYFSKSISPNLRAPSGGTPTPHLSLQPQGLLEDNLHAKPHSTPCSLVLRGRGWPLTEAESQTEPAFGFTKVDWRAQPGAW